MDLILSSPAAPVLKGWLSIHQALIAFYFPWWTAWPEVVRLSETRSHRIPGAGVIGAKDQQPRRQWWIRHGDWLRSSGSGVFSFLDFIVVALPMHSETGNILSEVKHFAL